MRKPKVITKCVANNYAGPCERIVEISDRHGAGALISVSVTEAGMRVDVYRRTRCEVIIEGVDP